MARKDELPETIDLPTLRRLANKKGKYRDKARSALTTAERYRDRGIQMLIAYDTETEHFVVTPQ